MTWIKVLLFLIIFTGLPLFFSGDSGCIAPLEGQQLRSYINSDLLVSIRAGSAADPSGYEHVIESAGAYVQSRCPPKTAIDSIRTAYIFAHLAFSFDAVESYKDVSNTFEQGRFYMGLLPDTIQIRLLRGVAWAYANQNKWEEAQRLALLSTRTAHRKGFAMAQQDSWLCYIGILEAQEGAQVAAHVPYWILPWLISGFLVGVLAGLVKAIKKDPAMVLIQFLKIP